MRSRTIVAIPSQQLNATINGPAIDTHFAVRCSAQAVIPTAGASSPSATIKLQGSNDITVDPSKVSNWSDIANATSTINAAGAFMVPVTEIAFGWVRAVVTYTSGQGTISVNMTVTGWGQG